MNDSDEMSLNAAKCQDYSFYCFWVIEGNPTGGKITTPSPQIRVRFYSYFPFNLVLPHQNQWDVARLALRTNSKVTLVWFVSWWLIWRMDLFFFRRKILFSAKYILFQSRMIMYAFQKNCKEVFWLTFIFITFGKNVTIFVYYNNTHIIWSCSIGN